MDIRPNSPLQHGPKAPQQWLRCSRVRSPIKGEAQAGNNITNMTFIWFFGILETQRKFIMSAHSKHYYCSCQQWKIELTSKVSRGSESRL